MVDAIPDEIVMADADIPQESLKLFLENAYFGVCLDPEVSKDCPDISQLLAEFVSQNSGNLAENGFEMFVNRENNISHPNHLDNFYHDQLGSVTSMVASPGYEQSFFLELEHNSEKDADHVSVGAGSNFIDAQNNPTAISQGHQLPLTFPVSELSSTENSGAVEGTSFEFEDSKEWCNGDIHSQLTTAAPHNLLGIYGQHSIPEVVPLLNEDSPTTSQTSPQTLKVSKNCKIFGKIDVNDKKERRRMQNRTAARKCRNRKKECLENMVKELEKANSDIKRYHDVVKGLNARIKHLTQELQRHEQRCGLQWNTMHYNSAVESNSSIIDHIHRQPREL